MARTKMPAATRKRQMQREFVDTPRRSRASAEEAIYGFRVARAEVCLGLWGLCARRPAVQV